MKVKPTTTASEVVMELSARDEALMEKASMRPSPFQIRNIPIFGRKRSPLGRA